MNANRTILGFKLEKHTTTIENLKIKEIRSACKNIPRIILDIILNRNLYREVEQINSFIDPKIKNLMPHPRCIKDIDSAVNRTLAAMERNESICILGDYDVDGSTSIAMLYRFLKFFNNEAQIYIPDRISEGYGPNVQAIRKLSKDQIKLIIMVDCGTLAFEEIALAYQLDIDVIVIDHHQSEKQIPKCSAVLNPNRLDEINVRNDLRYLCAAGVTFIFITALNMKLKEKFDLKFDLMSLIPFVGIATVCDVVPLLGLNRAFVSQAIKILNNKLTLYPAFQKLLECANFHDQINIHTFGFIIGPMINAGGRIDKSTLGAHLLSSDDVKIIENLSMKLASLNQERILMERAILDEIRHHSDKTESFFFKYSSDWHEGVIGIIASRVKDMLHIPTIVGSSNNGVIKCSARSISNVDIGKVILAAKAEGLLIKGGGHSAAAGFSIKESKYNVFTSFLHEKLNLQVNWELTNRTTKYDAVISLEAITLDLCNILKLLEPTGCKNTKPIFLIKDAVIILTKVLKEKHLRILLGSTKSSNRYWSICFGCFHNELGNYILSSCGKIVSILATINTSIFNEKENINIIVSDVALIN